MKHLALGILLILSGTAGSTISVNSVNSGSPAEAAGLQEGDRLVVLDGHPIATLDDLNKVMAAHEPGDRVPLTVRRGGESVDLELTFGERKGGGVSIGVRLNVEAPPGAESAEATAECLAWIDETYRLEPLMRELDLGLTEAYETVRGCVSLDTRRMVPSDAIRYCDNVFKVHCSGLDLLAEVGEAQVSRCARQLGESLGLNVAEHKAWKTCAQHKVFDRYSQGGEPIGEEACRTAFVDECGGPG